MTIYYTAATDGRKVIFRSGSRPYAFGVFGPRMIGFSNTPGSDRHPAVPLQRTEYTALVELKQARIRATGRNLDYTNPQDSWVMLAELPPMLAAKIESPRCHAPSAAEQHRSDR
jgi:hypothetical protein